MKPPEGEVIARFVDGWLFKAHLDLQSAELLLSADPPLLYPSCFHSQQAAEKYLKAYLTRRQVEFPRTHHIGQILDLMEPVDAPLAGELQSAAALTPYGVDVRYPQDTPEPSAHETRQALALARQVRDAVMARLKPAP